MSDKVVSIGSKKKKDTGLNEKPIEAKENKKVDNIEYCSFCKRPNSEIPKMVKGPGVNICSECTLIAVQFLILQDGLLSSDAQKILDMLWGQN